MPAPTLKAPTPPTPKRPTKALIAEYLDLEDRRKELMRQAAQLGKESADLKRQFEAFVRANTKGKTRELVICGYRMSILTVAGTVAWMKEFIARCGQDAADKVKDEAPPKEVFEIAKAA